MSIKDKIGIIVCLAIIGVTCIRSWKEERRKKELVAAYPENIKAYLEKKYWREFCVNPKEKAERRSPIPFAVYYSMYYFIAWEDEEDGYAFWTEVYPVSSDDKRVLEIRDSYCWKFISRKISYEIKKNWKEITEEACKIIVVPTWTDISFGEKICENSGIKDALDNIKPKTEINLFVIFPPESGFDETELTIEMQEIAVNFYNEFVEGSGCRLWIRVYETNTKEDYLKIEPEKSEQYWFGVKESVYENKDWIPVDIIPITTKIKM